MPSGPLSDTPIAEAWVGKEVKACSRCFMSKPLSKFNWYVDNRYGTQRPKSACHECNKTKSKGEYARKLAKNGSCEIEGCDKPQVNAKKCAMHYRHSQRAKLGECSVEGCGKLQTGLGLCPMHTRRLKKFGDVGPSLPARFRNGNWGEPQRQLFINDHGYTMVYHPEVPSANKKGYVLEHRWIMSEKLGRELYAFENVHHINGVKTDNRPENLELWVTSQPSGQRPSDLVVWSKQIIEIYDKS